MLDQAPPNRHEHPAQAPPDDSSTEAQSVAKGPDVRKGLAQYLRDLKSMIFKDGTPLVEFPKTFSAQVHLLMDQWKQRRRAGVAVTDLSPDELIAPAKSGSTDAEVLHGMTKIAKLDEALREKQLEHLMVSRETYPEKWLKHDSDRIRKHGESVEAALRKKRKEHARQRTLRLKLLELGHEVGPEQDPLATDRLLDRGFHLRQEDELLVESIMNRDPANEDINPFDLYTDSVSVAPRGSAAGGNTPSTLEELDTELMDLALDHDWNDCNSMMDTSTLGSLTTRKCIPEVALTVKRLGIASRTAEGVHSHQGHRWGGDMTLSVISEDAEYETTDCGAMSSTGNSSAASTGTGHLRRHRRRQHGRDYLTEMRVERDLGRLSDKIDKELRSLREMELLKASPDAVGEIVKQCLKQKEVHDERVRSGASVCEWLRTPLQHREHLSMHGAISLAGPATESATGSTGSPQLQ